MFCMGGEPTVRQVYALRGGALRSAPGWRFRRRARRASELIERLRLGDRASGAAALGRASAPAAAAQARRGADRPRSALLEGERGRGRARAEMR